MHLALHVLSAGLVALPSASAQSLVPAHPRLQEAIRMSDTWLDADVAYERVPGLAIGIVSDQQLVWAKGYGLADGARRDAVTPSTPFSSCSSVGIST